MKLGLYNDIGTTTCMGFPGMNVSSTPDGYADAQLQQDAEYLIGLGMDFFKVDGCFPTKNDFAAMNITYPKLGQALKSAAEKLKKPMPIYACSWPDYVGDSAAAAATNPAYISYPSPNTATSHACTWTRLILGVVPSSQFLSFGPKTSSSRPSETLF